MPSLGQRICHVSADVVCRRRVTGGRWVAEDHTLRRSSVILSNFYIPGVRGLGAPVNEEQRALAL